MYADGHISKQQQKNPEERIAILKGLLAEHFSSITKSLEGLPDEKRAELERKVVVAELLAGTIFNEITPSR